jgi:hypothetical protein
MTAFAWVALALAAQDTHDLSYRAAEGTTWSLRWKIAIEVKGTEAGEARRHSDMKMTIALRMKALKTRDDGSTEHEAVVEKLDIQGTQAGQDVAIVYEDGKVVKPEDPERAKALQKSIETPFRVSLSKTGRYELRSDHLLRSLLSGQSDFFGPQLPGRAAKAGETWEATVKSSNGPAVPILYTFAGVEKGLARITCDQTKPIEAGGFKMDFSMKQDGLFDPAAGLCVRLTSVVKAKGSGTMNGTEMTFEADTTVEMEASAGK